MCRSQPRRQATLSPTQKFAGESSVEPQQAVVVDEERIGAQARRATNETARRGSWKHLHEDSLAPDLRSSLGRFGPLRPPPPRPSLPIQRRFHPTAGGHTRRRHGRQDTPRPVRADQRAIFQHRHCPGKVRSRATATSRRRKKAGLISLACSVLQDRAQLQAHGGDWHL